MDELFNLHRQGGSSNHGTEQSSGQNAKIGPISPYTFGDITFVYKFPKFKGFIIFI